MHHPLQVCEPSLNSCFCEFPEAPLRWRAVVLEDAAERGATIFTPISHGLRSAASAGPEDALPGNSSETRAIMNQHTSARRQARDRGRGPHDSERHGQNFARLHNK